jgi:hypothetical protein
MIIGTAWHSSKGVVKVRDCLRTRLYFSSLAWLAREPPEKWELEVSHALTFNNAFSRYLKPLFPKAGPQFSLLAAFAFGLHGDITSFWHPGVSG